MPEIRLTVSPYQGAMVFDLHSSGNSLCAAQLGEEYGLFGVRKFVVFVVKPDQSLEFTLQRCKGDVHVQLPEDWDCHADTLPFNDFNMRLPKLTLGTAQGMRCLAGYVATEHLHLSFENALKLLGREWSDGCNHAQ